MYYFFKNNGKVYIKALKYQGYQDNSLLIFKYFSDINSIYK